MKGAARHSTERVLIIHSREPILDCTVDGGLAHAFGPFDSFEEAEAWNNAGIEDDCFKFAIPLVGPLNEDIDRSIAGHLAEDGEEDWKN